MKGCGRGRGQKVGAERAEEEEGGGGGRFYLRIFRNFKLVI